MTIILVSHSMEDVANYVDRIIVMNKGSVMLDGVPKDVFAHYKELEEVGLAAPAVTYIMQQLKTKRICRIYRRYDNRGSEGGDPARPASSRLNRESELMHYNDMRDEADQINRRNYDSRNYIGTVLSG